MTEFANDRADSRWSLLLMLGVWLMGSIPLWADGSLISVSNTQAQVSFQHSGYTAQGKGGFNGLPYKVCVQQEHELVGWACDQTDRQSLRVNFLEIGKRYRVKVVCHCKGSGRVAVARDVKIMDIDDYLHIQPSPQAPPPPPKMVQLRNNQSGRCLYIDANRIVRSWTCGPWPFMSFSVEPAAAGGLQIRHFTTGECLYGGFSGLPHVLTAPCGQSGTMVWINPLGVADTAWINIPVTEAAVPGYPPVKGPGGCLSVGPAQGDAVTKRECGNLDLSQRFNLDPV